jgi:hypothetical protein
MTSVEKEGMKLYEKLGAIATSESERLQESMEDFLAHMGPIGLHPAFKS